ncbi:MAG TPA: GIY-YIG nuclease family protein [Candidatus Acidoferrum sp.]|nr:GIY-YIG nuclease family protein [Candidatus Acidoferrum sp.]
MNKEHILQEIRRTAEANGGVPLGRDRFLKETGIRQSDWIGKYWARWGDAVREAGYTPNQLTVPYEDAFLFEKFIELTRSLGRIPAQGDLLMQSRADPTFPNATVFERFGSKASLLARLLEFCRTREGLEDIASLCEGHLSQIRASRRKPGSPAASAGFVYLMKSGKFFKIGRSNAAGRREYELGLQLPEPLLSVHVISTDDPPGIEAYWHTRFAAKRKNGEWFDLDPADVSAFKRRKFM